MNAPFLLFKVATSTTHPSFIHVVSGSNHLSFANSSQIINWDRSGLAGDPPIKQPNFSFGKTIGGIDAICIVYFVLQDPIFRILYFFQVEHSLHPVARLDRQMKTAALIHSFLNQKGVGLFHLKSKSWGYWGDVKRGVDTC